MTTYKPPCIVCGGEGCATSCASPRFVVTTGGTYIGSADFDAALRQLELERDEARKERDDAVKRNASLEALHYESIKAERIAYAELREENDRLTTERDEARAERDDYDNEIESLHTERDEALTERDGALAYIEHLRSELEDILQQRNEALRAIRQVLLSRDSAWKGGHDWQDAVDEAANVYRKFGPKGI